MSAAVTQVGNHLHQLMATIISRDARKNFEKGNKCCHVRFKYFCSFSVKTQRRLELADGLIEECLVAAMPFEAAFLLAALSRFILMSAVDFFNQGTHSLQIAHLLLEMASLMAVLLYTFRKALLFLKLLFLVLLAWCTEAEEIKRTAVAAMQVATVAQFACFRPYGKRGSNEQQQQSVLTTTTTTGLLLNYRFSASLSNIWTNDFMHDHGKLLIDLALFNRHFASTLIFYFFFPMIIASIYILCVVYFFFVPILLKLYLFFVYLSLLLIFGFLVLLPKVPQILYSADGYLYSAQMRCKMGLGKQCSGNSTFLRTKLKLMSYYEVLRTEKKVTFTFGSHAKVESKWLMEVNDKTEMIIFNNSILIFS